MPHSRKRRVAKIVVIGFAALILLLGVAVFIASRPFFIKAVAVPYIEKVAGISLDWESLALSPFSQVDIRGIFVKKNGRTVFKADHIKCEYDLLELLNKRIRVNAIQLSNATVRLDQTSDGEPVVPTGGDTQSNGRANSNPPVNHNSKKTTSFLDEYAVSIGGVQVDNLTVQLKRNTEGDENAVYAIKRFDLDAENIVSGERMKAEWSGDIRAESINLSGSDIPVSREEELNLGVSYQAAIDPSRKRIQVATLDGRIFTEQQDLVGMQLIEPVRLSYGENSFKGQGKIQTDLQNVPLRFSNSLLRTVGVPEDMVKIKKGHLNGSISMNVAEKGTLIGARGELGVRNLSFAYKGNTVASVALKQNFDVDLQNFKKLKITKAETVLKHDKTTALKFQLLDNAFSVPVEGHLREPV